MSVTATISVVRDGATPAVTALAERLSPQRLAAAVGPAVARCVERHLRGLGRNRRGWPTTHFWARAAKATSWAPHVEGAMVSVNQIGVRQRYHGGKISPVKAKALAIPISPVSYGHLPAEFPGLFLLKTKKGAYLVQYGYGMDGKKVKNAARGMKGNWKSRRGATLNFLFKLSGGVDQAGDPNVLPSHDEVREVSFAAIRMAARSRN